MNTKIKKSIIILSLSFLAILIVPSIVVSAITITTENPTGVNQGVATLNGTVEADSNNAIIVNFTFKYGETNLTCANLPTWVASSSRSGIAPGEINFAKTIVVNPNTTYYYCAVASTTSNATLYYGTVKSFTTGNFTPLTPANIVTGNATNVTPTNATINAVITPTQQGIAYFKYAEVNSNVTQPTTCGSTWSQTPYSSIGGNINTPYSINASISLTPSYFIQNFTKKYYYCPVFRYFPPPTNAMQEIIGPMKSLTVPRAQCGDGIDNDDDNKIDMLDPGCSNMLDDDEGTGHQVHTALTATAITDTTATLSGSAIPIPLTGINYPVYGYFRYSTKSPQMVTPIFCNEVFGDDMKSTIEVKISDNATVGSRKTFSSPISELDPNTTYYYCAVATDKNIIEYGKIESFTTANDPNVSLSSIMTKPASSVGANSAYLNGIYNSAIPSNTWFEYRKKISYQDLVSTVATLGPTMSANISLFPFSAYVSNINSSLNTSTQVQLGGTMQATGNFLNTTNSNTTIPTNITVSPAQNLGSLSQIPSNPYNWSGRINYQTHISGSSGTMNYLLNNLQNNTTYQFRAGIETNITGSNPQVSYGDILSFRTANSSVSDGDVENNSDNDSNNQELNLGDTATPPYYTVVRYHEGIEHVFVRQLLRSENLELAEMFGYQAGTSLEDFAWYMADFLARTFGYVSPSGKEIRVGPPDMAAYHLILKDGKLTVYEYFDSKIVDIQDITSSLRKNYEYEYYYTKKVSE